MSKKIETYSTSLLMDMLEQRYSNDAYAFFKEVPNSTGFSRRTTRYADALAMGLWPSRGIDLLGFEIKASRSDWLKELKCPEKADSIGKYCNRWFIVAPGEVVPAHELPDSWGLLVPRGRKLVIKKQAQRNKYIVPMDKLFIASLFRAFTRQIASKYVLASSIEGQLEAEFRRGREAGARRSACTLDRLKKDKQELEQAIKAFQEASGVDINRRQWNGWNGRRLGEAVKVVMGGGIKSIRRELTNLQGRIWKIKETVDKALEAMPEKEDGHDDV